MSLWKRNRVAEDISAVKDGDEAVEGGPAIDLDVFGVTDDPVEGYAGMGKDHCVCEVCRAQKVGCWRGGVNECELRVHWGTGWR